MSSFPYFVMLSKPAGRQALAKHLMFFAVIEIPRFARNDKENSSLISVRGHEPRWRQLKKIKIA